MKNKVIAVSAILLFLGYACHADYFAVKECDKYRVTPYLCSKTPEPCDFYVSKGVLAPGSLLLWPEKEEEGSLLHALTYAGIEDCEIVLTRDPGPSIRLPINGVFTRYAILEVKGVRIVLNIIHPDKIKAKLRTSHCRCR